MNRNLAEFIDHRQDILERVYKILIDNLGVRRKPDEIDPDTPLFGSGLGLDSVDAVELLICLEMEFDLNLPGDATGKTALRTANTLVDLVLHLEVKE